MATKTFKFKVEGGREAQGPQRYTGPVPPAGTYRCTLKRLGLKQNANGDMMLHGIADIAEPKGSGARKYNGYGIWIQQNITKQGSSWVNELLSALTTDDDEREQLLDDFWDVSVGATTKPDEKLKGVHNIIRIGSFKVGSPNCKFPMMIRAKLQKSSQYGDKLQPQSYGPVIDDGDDDDAGSDGIFEEFEEESESLSTVEDSDSVSSDPTDYDEDEEPEKVAAAKAKAKTEADKDEEDEDLF